MTPEEQSFKVTERLAIVLQDAIDHLTRDGDGIKVVDVSDQHAVRILCSRMRHLWRIHDQMYGSDEITRLRAAIGLQFDDNGDTLTYANIHHSCGRLDCRACSFEYVGAAKEYLSSICPLCKRGVVHIRRVFGPAEYKESFGTVVLNDGQIADWMICDACLVQTITMICEDTSV